MGGLEEIELPGLRVEGFRVSGSVGLGFGSQARKQRWKHPEHPVTG